MPKHDMDENPYESPDVSDGWTIRVKGAVRPPAICLSVLSVMALLADIPISFVNFVDAMRLVETSHFSSAALVGLCTLFVIAMHLFVLVGAVQMYRLTDYRLAKTAAVVSLVPLCSPGLIVGIPFGIWAFVVLSRNGVRESFTARKTRA